MTDVLFQDGHPDRLQCGLEVGGRVFLLDLEKNQWVWQTLNTTHSSGSCWGLYFWSIIKNINDVSCLCSDLLPKPPNVFYYLPNGTGVSVKADPVVSQWTHRSQSVCVCVLCFPAVTDVVVSSTDSLLLPRQRQRIPSVQSGSEHLLRTPVSKQQQQQQCLFTWNLCCCSDIRDLE